jgi:hypothetical protein
MNIGYIRKHAERDKLEPSSLLLRGLICKNRRISDLIYVLIQFVQVNSVAVGILNVIF